MPELESNLHIHQDRGILCYVAIFYQFIDIYETLYFYFSFMRNDRGTFWSYTAIYDDFYSKILWNEKGLLTKQYVSLYFIWYLGWESDPHVAKQRGILSYSRGFWQYS